MADRRLEEIRTSDDHESTINVELIDWLKTTGVNILLVVLLIVIAFRGFLWWQDKQREKRAELWADLAGTESAASLESLADRAQDVGSISELALLRAAAQYHRDILRDETLQLIPDAPTVGDPESEEEQPDEPKFVPMSAQERTETLDKMQRLYQRVYDTTAPQTGKPNWKETIHFQALFGLAAVAEMREQWDRAAELYTEIENKAKDRYPGFAHIAQQWRENPVTQRAEFVDQAAIQAALFKPLEELQTQPATPDGSVGPQPEGPTPEPATEMETDEPESESTEGETGDDPVAPEADGEGAAQGDGGERS